MPASLFSSSSLGLSVAHTTQRLCVTAPWMVEPHRRAHVTAAVRHPGGGDITREGSCTSTFEAGRKSVEGSPGKATERTPDVLGYCGAVGNGSLRESLTLVSRLRPQWGARIHHGGKRGPWWSRCTVGGDPSTVNLISKKIPQNAHTCTSTNDRDPRAPPQGIEPSPVLEHLLRLVRRIKGWCGETHIRPPLFPEC